MTIAILASTNGSNLPSFFSHAKALGIDCFVVSNKPDCGALQKAKDAHVTTFYIDPTGKTREQFDTEMLALLHKKKAEHIFCIGYMRIISAVLTNAFAGKIYNIHPSLLPAFAGGMDADVHAQVLAKGCKVSGATLHIVTDAVDEGPILLQKSCDVETNETADSLKAKVQNLEKGMLISYVEYLQTGHSPRMYHTLVPSVYCVFERDEKILFLKRKNTGYMDGLFSLPAGHVEPHESFFDAAIREAKEEVGVDIAKEDCEVVHVMQRAARRIGSPERISVFVKIKKWKGEACNAEPQKCEMIVWSSLAEIAPCCVPELCLAFENIQKGVLYSERDGEA